MLNYAKVVRAHSLDKLKLFHHFAKMNITDRNQLKMAFNTDAVYNDWKWANDEVKGLKKIDDGSKLGSIEEQYQNYKSQLNSEKIENFVNLSRKRNFISSFSMADLIELPVK